MPRRVCAQHIAGRMAFAAMGESGVDHCPPQEPALAKAGEVWSEEHARWQKRDLSAKRYVYCWADGIHLEARLEEQAQCILVIIGTTPEGRKELVGFTDGIRESSQSWRDLLLDFEASRPDNGAADSGRGWRARVLEGPRRGVADD